MNPETYKQRKISNHSGHKAAIDEFINKLNLILELVSKPK
jgi:hypothetical protein